MVKPHLQSESHRHTEAQLPAQVIVSQPLFSVPSKIGHHTPTSAVSAGYVALRTSNVNDVDNWNAPVSLSPGPSIAYTTTRSLGLSPTPGEVLIFYGQ